MLGDTWGGGVEPSGLYACPVEFEAAPARRHGKLLNKFQRDRGWVRGHLLVEERHDVELHRMTRVARLVATTSGGVTNRDVLPVLHDALLIAASTDWWTITGYERLPAEGPVPGELVCFQQSWFLVPAPAAGRPG